MLIGSPNVLALSWHRVARGAQGLHSPHAIGQLPFPLLPESIVCVSTLVYPECGRTEARNTRRSRWGRLGLPLSQGVQGPGGGGEWGR